MSSKASSPRVALFHPSLAFGGLERVMINLGRGLLELGVQVDFVPADASGPFHNFLPAGARLFDLHSPRVSASLWPLAQYLRRERPDCMIAGADHANVIAVAARKLSRTRTRLILGQHTIYSKGQSYAPGIRGRVVRTLAAAAYPRADAWLGVSQVVADDLAASLHLPRERVAVINNPVVTPEIQRLAAEPVRHPWPQDRSVPMILSAGRLLPEKDFPTLVRAFAELRRSTTCRLVILGEGPEARNLIDLAKQLGVADDFAFPGYAANIYAWMKQAAVFVLSSKWEGLSNVLVEAMSVGTPVISTDVAGPREVLEAGRWGRLTPPGDAEALAAAMRDTIGNPPAPASAECLARFDYLEVGRRYLALINSTLAARG